MSKGKMEHMIQCPFYKIHDDRNIRCEGIVPNSSIQTIFRGKNRKRDYFYEFCCDAKRWEDCAIAEKIKEKYDE